MAAPSPRHKRLLLTRPTPDDPAWADSLAAHGIMVHSLAIITKVPTPFTLPPLSQFDWLLFTSAAGAQYFFSTSPPLSQSSLAIAVVGSETAKVVQQYGFEPDFIPTVYAGATAATEWIQTHPIKERRILWPCGNQALPTAQTLLEAHGAQVTPLVVYQTQGDTSPEMKATLHRTLANGVEILAFASPSAVQAFAQMATVEAHQLIACIGPTTTQAAQGCFNRADIEAAPHTFRGLAQAIIAHLQAQEPTS